MQNIKDPREFNQLDTIDMEIDFVEDDDDFGGPIVMDNQPKQKEAPMKTISADFDDYDNLQIRKNYISQDQDYSGYNEIDMECSIGEDDEDDYSNLIGSDDYNQTKENNLEVKHYNYIADFGDDDEDFIIKNGEVIMKDSVKKNDNINYEDEIEPEFVSEDLLDEKRKKKVITQGQVEDDYWDRLTKKHKQTNVKGAHNTHFHLTGDPETNMKDFNHMMGSDISVSGGEEMSMGESVNPNYKKLFENLLVITGFKAVKDGDKIILTDLCDMIPEMTCNDESDVVNQLKPYIKDNFITPLQYQTGQNFKEPKEWCDWYTKENEEKFPKCKSDIRYCDLIANHLKDIKL